jgi:hypothetical protein
MTSPAATTLPSSYGQWGASIREFGLDSNMLSGSLPQLYGMWTELPSVRLSDNMLVGTLPSSYGNQVGIGQADFSSNNLTGSVPSSYKNNWAYLGLDEDNLNTTARKRMITGTQPCGV